MPEGDTIYRSAAQLRPVLAGRTIADAAGQERWLAAKQLIGRTVEAVEARGKHLLMRLDDGRVLHSHMGMTGSWHVYLQGERWRKPERRAALTLAVGRSLAVCFTPKTLELLSPDAYRRHPWLSRLGPDLLDPDFHRPAALARLKLHGPTPIGEAIMNQTLVCGVGNVYKAEGLFLCGMDPFASVSQFGEQRLDELLAKMRELMIHNLDGQKRRTRFGRDGQRLWVYDRSGEPCFRCGEKIQMRRQGDLGRSTYWCPSCQANDVKD